MDSIKHSPEAVLTFGLITAIGHTNTAVAKQVIDFFAAKAIGVTTNVAGPMTGRYLAGTRHHRHPRLGARARAPRPWACASSATTASSASGSRRMPRAVTDPEKLVHAFDDEMDTLVRLAAAV